MSFASEQGSDTGASDDSDAIGATGKTERDAATEPADATGHPPSQDGSDDAAPDETGGDGDNGDTSSEPPTGKPEPEPTPVQPPAMNPEQVALAGPAAAVRVHCDARCGQEWCLYAGNDFPADEAGEPYPDPRDVVMAAAGCTADPPTCPGAADTTRPDGAAGASSSAMTAASLGVTPGTPEARAAMLAASTTPDLAAAGLRTIRGPATLAERLGAFTGDMPAGAATVQPLRAPVPLSSAEAHGITAGHPPPGAALPWATGPGVLDVLRELGIEAGPLEDVIVEATPDPDAEPRPENPDPAE